MAVESMNVVSVVKVGRLTDGAQRDHGFVRHAMPAERYCWGAKSNFIGVLMLFVGAMLGLWGID